MKLQSMVEFVLSQKRADEENEIVLRRIIDYAKFLSQPLTLGMFVPCDKNGIVLESPKHYANNSTFPFDGSKESAEQSNRQYDYELKKYNEAKERVLFEGISISHAHDLLESFGNIDQYSQTHESTLTESAIKQLGL